MDLYKKVVERCTNDQDFLTELKSSPKNTLLKYYPESSEFINRDGEIEILDLRTRKTQFIIIPNEEEGVDMQLSHEQLESVNGGFFYDLGWAVGHFVNYHLFGIDCPCD